VIIIAHRGNLDGPTQGENTHISIEQALTAGFNVEVDIRCHRDKLFLGHDSPQSEFDFNYATDKKVWCHAKDLKALEILVNLGANCFWHQSDYFTLTSKNYIWTFPGQAVCNRSILVMKEPTQPIPACAGICTDYPVKLEGMLQQCRSPQPSST